MTNQVKEGDFILIDYDMKIDDAKKTIVETTKEETAKETGIHNARYTYQPELVVVGQGYVVKGLDENLDGMKIGEEKTEIFITPDKGFGRRDPKLIEERSVRWLKAKNIRPVRNVTFQEKGKMGRIISIKGNRMATVDFNPPLAGKTLIFDVKVNEIIKDTDKKVELLIKRHFGQVKDVEIDLQDDQVNITLPMYLMLAQGGQVMAIRLIDDIRRLIEFQKIKISYFFDYSTIEAAEKTEETENESSGVEEEGSNDSS
ncbi:MAG: FKBP-type peptidyl-prolyl cis-trans isomerase [Candidatus Hodarchaeales archaeon]|jgi:FKBP-type peptidyl-prolyl cis-trans isomerase 2